MSLRLLVRRTSRSNQKNGRLIIAAKIVFGLYVVGGLLFFCSAFLGLAPSYLPWLMLVVVTLCIIVIALIIIDTARRFP
ncbi:hypothetical protein A2671_00995 [Candidatus Kaiserbacteria bacterium RIFCSPHIGHO2_01_FULL_49_13]|uniref:Uncharacterized protein n=1 Tax=Candidatus Kaiserbacteria bacterium RIFCSPHIGHO2_01_FULL_49_13 TaxID=1798477 RepID=A0A1F6CF21_9BACT|nr:MAG: hypothetical protein A2671_00995 [Candidatus Kaiserbacteria bacterium RIFCSPHIGHO2_01_FULL_49_13]